MGPGPSIAIDDPDALAFALDPHRFRGALRPAPAAAGETKTVIELFTSKALVLPARRQAARELAKNERVVALSLPVDYWDYLGWRDTLALHAHSLRRRLCRRPGDRQVYTPQIVVNAWRTPSAATTADQSAIATAKPIGCRRSGHVETTATRSTS